MPTVYFGTRHEAGFELEENPNLIAVRTRDRRALERRGSVASPDGSALDDGVPVLTFPEVGVTVYRVPGATRSVEDRARALRRVSRVRFAGAVLSYPGTDEPVLYTENFYCRFRPDVEPERCEELLRAQGLVVREALTFAPNAYFAAAPEGTGQRVFDIARALLDQDEVLYAHPELAQRRRGRAVFPQQWHLQPAMIDGVAINAHASVAAAHDVTRGAGVTVAVIDDGVDIDHPEFAAPGKVVSPRDATLRSDDPRPTDPEDNHGTACAGVACAAGLVGASGVAPDARLMPIRLMSSLGSLREAEAFRWAADKGADVISCSWGPEDGRWWMPDDPRHTRPVQIPASTRDAIHYAATKGRGGRGCVVLFAAGNGNESVDLDGYASHGEVIAVAACNDRSRRSVYSDFGKAVWCAFPSNDFDFAPEGRPAPLTPGIWTTDRAGARGYNEGTVAEGDAEGHFTSSFGGTSSACPGAAGVAALVLAVNPSLDRAQVRDILRRACDRIDPAKGAYDASGHSVFYGYGRLNAEVAVRLARASLSPEVTVTRVARAVIPDLGVATATLEVTEPAPVTSLSVRVILEHTYVGDLVVTLVPPPASGKAPVVLHEREGGNKRDLDATFTPSNRPGLAAFLHTSCKGTWTLRVEDRSAEDSGTLVSCAMTFSV